MMLALSYALVLLGMVQTALGAVINTSSKSTLNNREMDRKIWNEDEGPILGDITNEGGLDNDLGLKVSIGALFNEYGSDWVKLHIKSATGIDVTDKAQGVYYKDGDIKQQTFVDVTREDITSIFKYAVVERDNWWWLGLATTYLKGIGSEKLNTEQGEPENVLKWLTGKKTTKLSDLTDEEYFENIKNKFVVLIGEEDEWQYGVIKDVDEEADDIETARIYIYKFDSHDTNPYWVEEPFDGVKDIREKFNTLVVVAE